MDPDPAAPAAADKVRRGPHADRRAATRRRLLDATIDTLVESGYSGTTTLRVQARAGVSRGALLHHFASRAELLMAAVDHLCTLRLAALHEESLRLSRSQDRLDSAIDLAWSYLSAPSSIAVIELWTAARTDPELAGTLRRNEPSLALQLIRACDNVVGPALTRDPAYPAFRTVVLEALVAAAMAQHIRGQRAVAAEVEACKQVGRRLFATQPDTDS